MSLRKNPPLPKAPFGLLLVEGGDERAVYAAVLGPAAWANLRCWYGDGRDDLPALATLAAADPNARFARAVGVVLDVEQGVTRALVIAGKALAAFGGVGAPAHASFVNNSPALGAFLAPDGVSHASIETLCRQAVRDARFAACVDALVGRAGSPHVLAAGAAKGWLQAYLGMLAEPGLRFHQAFSAPGGIDPAHAVFDPLRQFLLAL